MQGCFIDEWGNERLLEMNGESACRKGEIYYGFYYRKNSCKNLFEEGVDRVKVTLFISRGMLKFSDFNNRCRRK